MTERQLAPRGAGLDALAGRGDDLAGVAELLRIEQRAQAAHLDLALDTAQPGVKVTTSSTDFYPFKQMRLQKFNGTTWVPFGNALGS